MSFNQPIGNWDVGKVTTMQMMFNGATAFDQDISRWNVSKVTNFGGFLGGVTLSTENYNKLLMKWSCLPLQHGVAFHPGSSQYDLGKPDEARQYLINEFAWVFPPGTDSSTGVYYKDPGTVILLCVNP